MHKLSWVVCCFVGGFGCGSTVDEPDSGFDASSKKDAGSDVLGFDGPSDAPVEAHTVALDGGGAFLCNDCVCNGVANMCEHFSGGKMPFVFDAGDASACDPDAGQGYCAALPSDCLPNPTCACVLSHEPPACMCDLDPSGAGLVVTCLFP